MGFIGLSIVFLSLWIFMEKKAKWSLLWRALLYSCLLGVIVLPFFNPLILINRLPLYLLGAILYIACTGYLLLSNKDSKLMQVFYLIAALSLLPYLLKLPVVKKNAFPVEESGEILISLASKDKIGFENDFDLTLQRLAFPKRPDETHIDDVYTIDVNEANDVEKVYCELSADPRVQWMEYNDLYKVSPTLSPDGVQKEWRTSPVVNDPKVSGQWAFRFLNMGAYHAFIDKQGIKPLRKARLFILDSGIEAVHEDLAATYKSFEERNDTDTRGHGTHCGGIAAAVSNNGIGVASLNPGSDWIELTSIKVISRFGFAPQSAVIKGIIDATDQGADVISMSLGGRSNDMMQEAYDEAVKYALDQGVIVVASAGNSNMSAALFSPANVEGIIAVSALNSKGQKASFSNTVNEVEMGIAAPGEQILSTDINNSYSYKSGTSMSGPVVAGLAAVSKSLNPSLTSEEFYQLLDQTGRQGADAEKVGLTIQPLALIKTLN